MSLLQNIVVKLEQPLLETGSLASPVYAADELKTLREHIKKRLLERDAVLVAHYYVDAELQRLAEETGGKVSDSLEMARFGHQQKNKVLVVAGVRFMGETAKILNPEKRILMPTLEAECSLDLKTPAVEFIRICDQHPDRTVVVYANTSAAVKARADWVVTSSNALDIVNHLKQQNKKILFAPDKHLGRYIESQTGADMLIWDGACVVHEAFKADALARLRKLHPHAAVLVHPESPQDIVAQADVVGSTTRLIQAVKDLPNHEFIVATDNGIFHKMQMQAGSKKLIEAPVVGVAATCVSCAHCPWMAMNSLRNLADVLDNMNNEIFIDETIRKKALVSTQRMIDFKNNQVTD